MIDIKVYRSDRGYYVLYVNGKSMGNYDTYNEAIKDASDILDEHITEKVEAS